MLRRPCKPNKQERACGPPQEWEEDMGIDVHLEHNGWTGSYHFSDEVLKLIGRDIQLSIHDVSPVGILKLRPEIIEKIAERFHDLNVDIVLVPRVEGDTMTIPPSVIDALNKDVRILKGPRTLGLVATDRLIKEGKLAELIRSEPDVDAYLVSRTTTRV